MGKIITLSRQFGSGGREIGKRVSDLLNISYYDKELIRAVAEDTGFDVSHVEKYSEAIYTNAYPYSFGRTFSFYHVSPAENIQIAQLNIIKNLAERGDCIIIGRCADYILRELDPVRVFIHCSDMDYRINRCFEKVPHEDHKTHRQLEKEIQAVDKERSKYYEYYTGATWGKTSNYDLCINTAKFDVKSAAEIIANAVK